MTMRTALTLALVLAPAANGALAEHVAALTDSITSLRASMRAASDETAVMDQTDSVQIVTAAITSATEEIERARDALRALSELTAS